MISLALLLAASASALSDTPARVDWDEPSMNPLHAAAASCRPAEVVRLVDRGADLDARDDRGRTPAMAAYDAGCRNLALDLIYRGASIDAADSSGETLLSRTVHTGGYEDIANVLAL